MKRNTQNSPDWIHRLYSLPTFPPAESGIYFLIFLFLIFYFFILFKFSFILLSHNISQPQLPFPPLLPASPLVSKCQSSPLHLPWEEIRPLRSRKHQLNMTHDTIRPGTIPHIRALRGNPVEGKRSQEQTKESETSPTGRSLHKSTSYQS